MVRRSGYPQMQRDSGVCARSGGLASLRSGVTAGDLAGAPLGRFASWADPCLLGTSPVWGYWGYPPVSTPETVGDIPRPPHGVPGASGACETARGRWGRVSAYRFRSVPYVA